MVAFAARENLAFLYDFLNFWRKERLWMITYAYYNKLQFFNSSILQFSINLFLVSIALHHQR